MASVIPFLVGCKTKQPPNTVVKCYQSKTFHLYLARWHWTLPQTPELCNNFLCLWNPNTLCVHEKTTWILIGIFFKGPSSVAEPIISAIFSTTLKESWMPPFLSITGNRAINTNTTCEGIWGSTWPTNQLKALSFDGPAHGCITNASRGILSRNTTFHLKPSILPIWSIHDRHHCWWPTILSGSMPLCIAASTNLATQAIPSTD